MAYIKILLKNKDTILGVEEIEEPCFVTWQEKNQIHIRCDERSALGIVSADGSTTYQIKGKPALPDCNTEMYAEIIDKYDFEFYQNQLGSLGEEESPPENEPSENSENEELLTPERMRAKIIELEEQVELLTDCILEMSGVVYNE